MRIAILGNSGSGKSTLARRLSNDGSIATLDLDTIYWEPGQIAVERAIATVLHDLDTFCTRNDSWIIEGCYGSLIEHALRFSPELIFLDPGKDACLVHCRSRPWEPHKYVSKEQQDAGLEFLFKWVDDYYDRDDEMSWKAHRAIYDAYEDRSGIGAKEG